MAELFRMTRLCCLLMKSTAALAVLAASGAASAQEYPAKPVRIVVAFAAGGGVDLLTRVVVQHLGPRLKQTIIVDNRPGANANLGADFVAKSPADGYTLLMASSVFAASRGLSKKLTYDGLTDFTQVARVGLAPSVLVVSAALPVKSIAELIAYGRAHAADISYASTGFGSGQHLNGVIFSKYAGLPAVHVPYKGGSLAMTDILTGRVTFFMTIPGEILPHIAAGKVRALAVTGSSRAKFLPDVPTLTEAGVPNPGLSAWWGLVAPAKTPKAVVERLSAEMLAVLGDPETRAGIEKIGVQVAPLPAQEFAQFYRNEVKRYMDIGTEFKIEME